MPFQASVNTFPAIGVAGDFASANPRASALAGEASLIAGADGVTVGVFAWADNGLVANTGTGVSTGFVGRENNAFIEEVRQEAGNIIPTGQMVTLYTAGDFLAKTTTNATAGQKVFASTTDGTVSTGAAGATVSGSVETKWTVANNASAGELITMTSWA